MKRRLFDSLGIEALESRTMMAGDVAAGVHMGDLLLRGDKLDNEVVIRATDTAGQYRLEGLNGTTINGQSSITVQNVEHDVRISLGEGNNRLLLTAEGPDGEQPNLVLSGNLEFDAGTGDDILVLDNVLVHGGTSVKTDDGHDGFVTYESELVGPLKVSMGDGEDFLGFDTTQIRRGLSADLGASNDVLLVVKSDIRNDAEVNLGSGDDYMAVSQSLFHDDLEVDGNNHLDIFVTFNSQYLEGVDLDNVEKKGVAKSEDTIADHVGDNPTIWQAIELVFAEGTAF